MRLISHSSRTRSFHLSQTQRQHNGSGRSFGGTGAMCIFILSFVRGVVRGFIRPRYRPELHYMRGPGPKWIERHGPLH
jgi:hypothetical protein